MLLHFLMACGGTGVHPLGQSPVSLGPDAESEDITDAPGAGFPFDGNEVFEIALDIPQSSIDGMCLNCGPVPATFKFAGFEHEVGIRYKGASTYDTLDGKPSFKISFDEYTPGARFLGLERLTLNGMKFDPSKLREAVAYHLWEQLEVPAPRWGYAHLTVNGQDLGLYGLLESLDEHFLSRAYPDNSDGNLYDTTFISSDLTTAQLPTFVQEEGDPATAGADLTSLVSALDTGNILDVIQTRFDPESTFRFLALDLAGPNYDGYSRNMNNYLLYHAMPSDKWYFVPWGQDRALYGGGPIYAQMKGRIATACSADPACQAEITSRIYDLLDIWEGQDLLGWTQGVSDEISALCASDPRKKEDCDQQQMLDHLTGRPDEVRMFLENPPPDTTTP